MTIKIELIRPDDLLNLQVELDNLKLDKEDPQHPVLRVANPDQPAFARFIFPPQSIVENAYFEATIVKPDADPGKPPDPDLAGPATVHEPFDPPGQLFNGPRLAPDRPRRVLAKLAHPSRLVFRVPADARIPFSVKGLLDWSQLQPSLNPIAAISRNPTAAEIAGAPAIRAPLPNETTLELPFRLSISPTAQGVWAHADHAGHASGPH